MPTLEDTYLRLRPDSSVELLPADGFWPKLMSGQLGTFQHEYLVTSMEQSQSWTSWEQHPLGDEIVCLLSGHVTLVQERDGMTRGRTRSPAAPQRRIQTGTALIPGARTPTNPSPHAAWR